MSADPVSSGYITPHRMIFNAHELELFKKSETAAEIAGFVKACADAIVGKKISDVGKDVPESASSSSSNGTHDNTAIDGIIEKVVTFLHQLHAMIDEIPPLKQPMRFGNKAFRTFHTRLCEESLVFLQQLLPAHQQEASVELAAYLCTSFGKDGSCFSIVSTFSRALSDVSFHPISPLLSHTSPLFFYFLLHYHTPPLNYMHAYILTHILPSYIHMRIL